MKFIDYMLDIETFSSASDAMIVAIGVAKFDPNAGEHKIDDGLYLVVNPRGQQHFGRLMDPDTIMWWLGQSEAARTAISHTKSVDLGSALEGLSMWMDEHSAVGEADVRRRVWGNGATFDNVIVANAYKALGLQRPWSFRDDMCYRTYKNTLGRDIPPVSYGTAHQALDDAVAQAYHLQSIVKVRGIVV